MRKVSLLVLAAMVVAMLAGIPIFQSAEAQAPVDFNIANGHFFTQTNGHPAGTDPSGYAVTNNGGVPFWDEFQRLGGVQVVGYPMSRRFEWDGFTTQVFQKVVFQWQPQQNRVFYINTFDQMHEDGKDDWLLTVRSTPKPLGPEFDAGLTFAQAQSKRLALLDANPAIKAVYNSVQSPIDLFGLPTSEVVDNGNHFAMRFQRAVIQQWKVAVPWAAAGQATIANGGDVSVEAGMFSAEVTQPEFPPGMATPTPMFTPTPVFTPTATATPVPAFAFTQRGGIRYENNAGTSWVEGRIYNPDGSGRNNVVVKVTGRDGLVLFSRPTGGEWRPDPNGVWVVTLRSPASEFIDYSWTAEVWEDGGQRVTSQQVTFFTDREYTSPSNRQVAYIDFQRN